MMCIVVKVSKSVFEDTKHEKSAETSLVADSDMINEVTTVEGLEFMRRAINKLIDSTIRKVQDGIPT